MKLLDTYSVGETLGEGAFGVVATCIHRRTGKEYAVKMVDRVETPLQQIQKEADLMQSFDNENIVAFHGVFFETCFVCIVMDKYDGGDLVTGLQAHMSMRGPPDSNDIVHVAQQLGGSIRYLHGRNVVHRDIKGDNYLMDRRDMTNPECHIVLTDFGTSTYLQPGQRLSEAVGTKLFWSPEFYDLDYGLKVDVWALGVIMYGLVTGRFPFKNEEDVNHKKIQVQRASEECAQLIKGMLERNEAARFTAQKALQHAFCQSAVNTQRPDVAADPGPVSNEITKESIDNYQQNRRCDIVSAMQNAQNRRKRTTALQLRSMGSEGDPMQVAHFAGNSSKFQWFDTDKANQHGFHDTKDAIAWVDDSHKNKDWIKRITERMLKDHRIDLNKFGVGEAKIFDEFLLEIQKGAASLLIDASKHKMDQNIVRVVDLVLLRIEAKAPSGVKQYLIKTSEKFPDGRERSDLNHLPGTKKEPHENAMQTVRRVVKERLDFAECRVQIDFTKKETYEEDTSSPSYPGIRTVYRAEIFEGIITNMDASLLKRIGALDGGTHQCSDSKGYHRTYQWMTEAECMRRDIKLKIGETKDFSALVHAPVSPNEEEIKTQLRENGVTWQNWENGKFEILTEELARGEAALVKVGEKLLRVVDIVVVKVMKEASVLAETEAEDATGKKTTLNWLPAVKRRPDENMFFAAKRCVTTYMWTDENAVTFNTSSVLIAEEEKESQTFPGLNSLYRKRIITADLVIDESSTIVT
mmetsp:Transcript_21080/g.41158  ORF Transcript_21080/g.41158 Transcript_21080/m.41158 type:complete len:749 (-) Transcript_21080:283-2529(-)